MASASFLPVNEALCGGSIAMMSQTVAILARATLRKATVFGVALMICGVAKVVLGSRLIGPSAFDMVLDFMASMGIPAFWLFSRAWFDDSFSPIFFEKVLIAAYIALTAAQSFWSGQFIASVAKPIDFAVYVAGSLFAVHALVQVWRGRDSDLVEPRRRARAIFIVSVAVLILWTLWSEAGGEIWGGRQDLRIIDNLLIFLVTFIPAATLFDLRYPDILPCPAAVAGQPCAPKMQDEPRKRDDILLEKLERLACEERFYRDPAITIGILAVRLNVPDHRLRRAINSDLGYRNFNEYLNARRLDEISTALTDPLQSETPILTIALDAGFGSLSAFNRAFKALHGKTPSEFRREASLPD
ncbi:AraC family transcriptional regulator [Acetobacter orleanensis]|uniref:Transcriptional regulator n=1 Tax=Acetobacter orleanensis TaxID=104099 RepID=A0A4Y3TQ29_9PROT|nr:helix-turn-helix domain-containing protein [Acetobacter orleanensis]PCD78636.1 AraC family transcriptional regulator [Acetobacter orleanensis]GAN67300.1 transcriptional regulator AraC [Acetobacter orleanensis JCM 7639]GBR23880.1 AraC family transcriptional regulator [Acetobacter orleanensis NRIC 0473]GEB83559.1 transcriptional regulator [Acetobacter orleanensis]